MGEFSLTHILLLSIIVLIFFGPSRLPALGQSLGKAIRGFKQGLNEIDADVKPVQEQQATTQIKSNITQQQAIAQSTHSNNTNMNAGMNTNAASVAESATMMNHEKETQKPS